MTNAAPATDKPGLFVYPGGKTWFLPYARAWLQSLGAPVPIIHEPFAGGAAVSLDAVLNGLAERAVLVELDEQVAAVWQCIARGYGPILANTLARTGGHGPPVVLNGPFIVRAALKALVDNRTHFGGILGVTGRPRDTWRMWPREKLVERVQRIHALHDRFEVIHGDAFAYLERRAPGVYFVDPPYPLASRGLYRHWVIDHRRLFNLLADLDQPFLMTYEDLGPIRKLARERGFATSTVPMKNNRNRHTHELVIGNDVTAIQREVEAV